MEAIKEAFPLAEEHKPAFEGFDEGSVSEAAKQAGAQSLQILAKWKSDLPSEVVEAVSILARMVGYGSGPPQPKVKAEVPEGMIQVSKEALFALGKLVDKASKGADKLRGKKPKQTDAEDAEEETAERIKEAVDKALAVKEAEMLADIKAGFSAAIEKEIG